MSDQVEPGLHYDQHVRRLARAAGLPARHRLIQLGGVGHAGGDVLAAPEVLRLVFGRP